MRSQEKEKKPSCYYFSFPLSLNVAQCVNAATLLVLHNVIVRCPNVTVQAYFLRKYYLYNLSLCYEKWIMMEVDSGKKNIVSLTFTCLF